MPPSPRGHLFSLQRETARAAENSASAKVPAAHSGWRRGVRQLGTARGSRHTEIRTSAPAPAGLAFYEFAGQQPVRVLGGGRAHRAGCAMTLSAASRRDRP